MAAWIARVIPTLPHVEGDVLNIGRLLMPNLERDLSGQLEARRAASRAEAAERELVEAAWISRMIPRLYNEPHNIGGLLLPHFDFQRGVANIVLGYVIKVNGSGILRRTDGEEVPFKVGGCASLNRLGYWATQEKNWPEVPVRVILQGSNVELPVVGECGALMNLLTGSFPDLELQVGAGANVYSTEGGSSCAFIRVEIDI